MKLLSICIPTYNRPDKLKELYQSFLSRALEEYGDKIEVIVRDNSDDKNARLNRASLGSKVRYYKNETNIGPSGNLIRLVREATGQFIWIISDDDLILYDGFKCLMDCLPCANDEGIACLIIPFSSRDPKGKITVYYRQKDFGINGVVDISTFLRIINRPFIFFPTGVIRLDKKRLDWVAREFQGNVFIQMPLFLSMLKPESKVCFLDTCVIEYKPSYNIGTDIITVHNSMRDVILFLESEYGVHSTTLRDQAYKESLSNILNHRAGIRNFENGDIARGHILTELGSHLNIRTIILAFMAILPKILMKWPYIFFLSYQDARANGNISIGNIIIYSRERRHFINTKQNKRRSTK